MSVSDLPVDSSVVNSDVWSASAINDNPWPFVVVGLTLLVYAVLVVVARRRDVADVVETKLKEKKWEQQMRANATSASEQHQTWSKIFKKRFQSLHLWLSVVYRPHGDCYTSVERVTCLGTFVYCDMALLAVGFGSDFDGAASNFWVILVVATVMAALIVQVCIEPFFTHSGPQNARAEWLERQKQEAARGRGLSIPVDDGAAAAARGPPSACDACYGHCCGRRYPEWCKYAGFVCCGLASLLAIFVTLNWGTKFVLHESGHDAFGGSTSLNRSALWIVCLVLSFAFDIVVFRPLLVLCVAGVAYCTRDKTPIPSAQANDNNAMLVPDAATGIELHTGATAV